MKANYFKKPTKNTILNKKMNFKSDEEIKYKSVEIQCDLLSELWENTFKINTSCLCSQIFFNMISINSNSDCKNNFVEYMEETEEIFNTNNERQDLEEDKKLNLKTVNEKSINLNNVFSISEAEAFEHNKLNENSTNIVFLSEKLKFENEMIIEPDYILNDVTPTIQSESENEADIVSDYTFNDVKSTKKNDFVKIADGYKCQICMKITKNKAAILAHLNSHLETSRLCFHCGKLFDDQFKAKFHHTVCKNNLKLLKFNEETTNLNLYGVNYNDNYNTEGIKTKTCPICFRKFSKSILTLDHMNCHTKEKPYVCSCGAEMAFYSNFIHHIKKFKCPLNGSTLPKYCNYGMKTKRPKKKIPNICKICNLNFSKNDIKQHFSTEEHLIKENQWIKKYVVKKYICNVCKINFDNISKLILHEIDDHKSEITSGFFRKLQKNSKHCDICNKTFTKRIHYFDHMNMHNNILPYMCSCGQKLQHYETFISHFKKKGCAIEGRIFPDYCPKTFQTSVASTVKKS